MSKLSCILYLGLIVLLGACFARRAPSLPGRAAAPLPGRAPPPPPPPTAPRRRAPPPPPPPAPARPPPEKKKPAEQEQEYEGGSAPPQRGLAPPPPPPIYDPFPMYGGLFGMMDCDCYRKSDRCPYGLQKRGECRKEDGVYCCGFSYSDWFF